MKCWICETEYTEPECPKCGPPQPWGPTPEELADDDKRDLEDEQYWSDSDYAQMVCQKRHGPL